MSEETIVPKLMTVQQVAQILQVSTRTVWRLRSARQLPEPVLVGSSIRWNATEFRQWIEAGCPPLTSGE